MSLVIIPSGKLKNLGDFDKWRSWSICCSVGECQSLESLDCTCAARMGKIALLSPIQGDIEPSINVQ